MLLTTKKISSIYSKVIGLLTLTLAFHPFYGHAFNYQTLQQNDSVACVKFMQQADSLLKINDQKNAIESAKQAYNIASEHNYEILLLRINLFLGDSYFNQRQTDLAIRHYLSAISNAENLKDLQNKKITCRKTGDAFFNSQVYEKAIEYYEKAYQLSLYNGDESLSILEDVGLSYLNSQKNSEAFSSFDSIVKRTEQKPSTPIRIRAIYFITEILQRSGEWDNAIAYNQKLFDWLESSSELYGMALVMNNIGVIQIKKNDSQTAIESFKTALTYAEQSNAPYELTIGILTNIGIGYQNIDKNQQARESILQAIDIAKNKKDKCKTAELQNLLALIYYNDGDLYNAHEYSRSSIENLEKEKCLETLQACYRTYSIILRDGNDYINALSYYEKYLKIKDSVLFEKRIDEQSLSDQLAQLKETENKQQLFIADQQMKDLQVKQLKLESEKKEQQISLLTKEKELEQSEKNRLFQSLELSRREHEAALHQSKIKDLEQQNRIKELDIQQKEAQEKDRQKEIALLQGEKERQKLENEKLAESRKRVTWMLVLSSLIIVLVAISYFVTKKKNLLLAQQKKEIQEKNSYLEEANEEILQKNAILSEQSEEIRAQNEEITTQKEMIEKKNTDITDSIQYARFIQSAILPEGDTLNSIFSQHFILYRPKDIVSGDFWWFEKTQDRFIVTVADCTGHGVPGALLSMLGTSYLHEIVSINPAIKANELLFELRKMVVDSLKSSPTRDGMDIATCIFNFEKKEVEIAAANNSVYIIQNSDLTIIKADKMPIGLHPLIDKPYTQNILKFSKDDKFYLFTDGFADQFGGEDGKKLKTSNFRDMIIATSNLDMQSQKEKLEQELDDWMGFREQVDDITVVGVTI